MTRQYDVRRSNESSQKGADNWILQRTAVRSQPAKTLTPQTQSPASDLPAAALRDRSGIKVDLMQIPVSNRSANPTQLQGLAQSDRQTPVQRQEQEKKAENKTGLPDRLKEGIESLSGYDLSGVRVNYNSPKPAQLNAHAYTQGQAIEVAPRQERHLPHEAWHVVQQMQGRVRPTMEVNGVDVNGDRGLESEADVMGKRAVQMWTSEKVISQRTEGAPKNKPCEEGAISESSSTSPKKKKFIPSTDAQREQRENSSHRLMTSGEQVLQMVAVKELKQVSEHGSYMLSKKSDVLYSKLEVPEPKPKGLYKDQQEKMTGKNPIFDQVVCWKPNVSFFTKAEQDAFRDAQKNNDRLSESEKKKGEQQINNEKHMKILTKLSEVEVSIQNGAKMGIVGDNDCGKFAMLLHQLIKEETEVDERAGDDPIVGTYMQHKFPDKLNGCGYHVATVVAKDGKTLVTLEAHAGKELLEKPEFHMRNGVEGFRSDNTPKGLDAENAKKWQESAMYMIHPDKQIKNLQLGTDASIEKSIEVYKSMVLMKNPSQTDIELSMAKMGLTRKK